MPKQAAVNLHLTTERLAAMGGVICVVEAEDGTTGVGVSIGGEPACNIIEMHLSRFVEGQDPRCVITSLRP